MFQIENRKINPDAKRFGRLVRKLRLKNKIGLRALARVVVQENGRPISSSYLSDIELVDETHLHRG